MIRNTLKRLYLSGLSLLQADRRTLRALAGSGMVSILNLHRVSPEPDPYWPPLHPELFLELVQWLASNFHVTTLEQLKTVKTDRPVAVLSFDDGYSDFIEYAVPILNKFGLSANMNIIPECAESGRPMWNVRLYDFLKSAPFDEIRRIDIPGFSKQLESDSLNAKLQFGLAVRKFLKNRSMKERKIVWRPVEEAIERHDFASTRMMTTDEIRQLADSFEIGAHSYSHESMGFETDEFFLDDLSRCEAYFSGKLGISLSIYAFPNGSYRTSQIELLRSHGIKHILLVDEQDGSRNSDVLTRRTMYGDSAAEVKFRALGRT